LDLEVGGDWKDEKEEVQEKKEGQGEVWVVRYAILGVPGDFEKSCLHECLSWSKEAL
jgi:hypothetical protein